MEVIRERVGRLDVHRDFVAACALHVDGRRRERHKERFATTTRGLAELSRWLSEHGVATVAMEATGVYWKPVVRHEALFDREGMKGPLLRTVAAVR
jgi:transposase